MVAPFIKSTNEIMKNETEQTEAQKLSDSLLSACKAAGIEEPKYIAQDEDGDVYHYRTKPVLHDGFTMWGGQGAVFINHQPYAEDWRESLMEFVKPHELIDGDDDACKIAYRKFVSEYAYTPTPVVTYRRAWQDALKYWNDI